MSEYTDPVQALLMALIAAAVMIAAAPHLFMQWLRHVAEQQRAATLRQVEIQQDLLRRLAARDSAWAEAGSARSPSLASPPH
jgi:hypothetical protein